MIVRVSDGDCEENSFSYDHSTSAKLLSKSYLLTIEKSIVMEKVFFHGNILFRNSFIEVRKHPLLGWIEPMVQNERSPNKQRLLFGELVYLMSWFPVSIGWVKVNYFQNLM